MTNSFTKKKKNEIIDKISSYKNFTWLDLIVWLIVLNEFIHKTKYKTNSSLSTHAVNLHILTNFFPQAFISLQNILKAVTKGIKKSFLVFFSVPA